MERRKIHTQGPELSRIISGVWRWHTVSRTEVDNLINTALDLGITTFDNADIYGDHRNEDIFGTSLKKNPAIREKMQLVTKCGIKFRSGMRPDTRVKHYDTSRKHIIWSAENSLKMLGTDRIDLLLIHRPDPMLDPDEVAGAFSELKASGKVLHFGVSNFTAWQFDMLQSRIDIPLVTNQVEMSVTHYHPLFDGTLDRMMKERISPMAWSPLGGGTLMGRQNDRIFSKAPAYRCSNSQLALSWLLKHPSVVFPVIGTTKPDRIRESADALKISLDLQDWFEMLETARGIEMP